MGPGIGYGEHPFRHIHHLILFNPEEKEDRADRIVISALTSRYSSIVLLPYYLALGSQILASLYAATFVPETLPSSDRKTESDGDSDDQSEDEDEASDNENEGLLDGVREVVEDTMEAVIAPVQPLGLLMPHRNEETGKVEWRLFLVTVSLLATTCGVSRLSLSRA